MVCAVRAFFSVENISLKEQLTDPASVCKVDKADALGLRQGGGPTSHPGVPCVRSGSSREMGPIGDVTHLEESWGLAGTSGVHSCVVKGTRVAPQASAEGARPAAAMRVLCPDVG